MRCPTLDLLVHGKVLERYSVVAWQSPIMTAVRTVIWRYYVYRATLSNGFYLPVGILYLQHQGFGLDVIGLTQGVFGFALVAAEIPTGYVGDRLGRRTSLATSSAITTVVMVAYVVVDSPLAYVGLYVLWAVGWSFESGTGDAWLYELLRAELDESEYARVKGRGTTVSLLTSAVSAILAGLLVPIGWALPFLAGAALSVVGIPVLSTLPSVADDADGDDGFTVVEAVRTLRLQVERTEIRWLVVYTALFYGLFDVMRAFEQPAADAVGVPVTGLGVLYAALKLVSAGAASTVGWFDEHVGVAGVFAALVPLVGGAYLAIAVVPVAVVPVIFLTRGIRSVTLPLRNQYLNDRMTDVGRATVLSGVSMVLSLAGGTANVVAGEVAARVGLLTFLAVVGVGVAATAGLVWVTTTPIRPGTGVERAEGGREATSD